MVKTYKTDIKTQSGKRQSLLNREYHSTENTEEAQSILESMSSTNAKFWNPDYVINEEKSVVIQFLHKSGIPHSSDKKYKVVIDHDNNTITIDGALSEASLHPRDKLKNKTGLETIYTWLEGLIGNYYSHVPGALAASEALFHLSCTKEYIKKEDIKTSVVHAIKAMRKIRLLAIADFEDTYLAQKERNQSTTEIEKYICMRWKSLDQESINKTKSAQMISEELIEKNGGNKSGFSYTTIREKLKSSNIEKLNAKYGY